MTRITNFGGNVEFEPQHRFRPQTETELLDILRAHRDGCVRVVGARHAWSEAIVSPDTLIDLQDFRSIKIVDTAEGKQAIVGAGCRMKDLLAELNQHGLTTPSIGLVTEQAVAGAVATGTHGSGKHSLSHYVQAMRIACFPNGDGEPEIVEVNSGDDLKAARCSLGSLGVVVSVTLPCVPQYNVAERSTFWDSIEEVLALETRSPLQQFFLMPHRWRYMVQERSVTRESRRGFASLYRIYWFGLIDVALHLVIKLSAAWMKSRLMVRKLFQWLVFTLVFPSWRVVDRSDRMLVMEHELFQHLELEAFVPDSEVASAARFVEQVLKQAAGEPAELSPETIERLRAAGLWNDFEALAGRFLHHYPVCFRKVLRDDTLISMAAGEDDAWYAISFITYVKPRDRFYELARFLARSLLTMHRGRIHWGKWFPFEADDVARMYPEKDRFLAVCEKYDSHGVFANAFVRRVLRTDLPAAEVGNQSEVSAAGADSPLR